MTYSRIASVFVEARRKVLGPAIIVLGGSVWFLYLRNRMAKTRANGAESKDADAIDPPLLRKHSEIVSYTAKRSGITYPGIRVFYRRHPKADELPQDPAPLPLVVFIHGLGGCIAQFHPLLTSLVNSASCLAVDLPGCGLSHFAPKSWDAYTTDALIDLLETVIDSYREKDQGLVLIAHSMGTAMAARIANKHSHVMGLVAICPVSGPPPPEAVRNIRVLLSLPDCIFNLWRAWDRWGGPESASVKRFVGPGADLETRQLQDKFNSQSRTPVFRRMAWGALPKYSKDGKVVGGLFDEPTWTGLSIPVYLIGGEYDTVTPPTEIEKIRSLLESTTQPAIGSGAASPNKARSVNSKSHPEDSSPDTLSSASETGAIVDAAAPVNTSSAPRAHMPESIEAITDDDFARKQQQTVHVEDHDEDPTTPREDAIGGIPPQPRHPAKVVKTAILPAGHAMLYTPTTVRTLAGLIGDFMNDHITGRFSLGWQLQHLSRDGKWDVKNLAKWKSVQPVSEPIGGIFRAMKTLREVDEEHSPKVFASKWGHIIKDIIDISHADPVYDPKSFGEGIKYHKFPTVSKIPPTDAEVASFIKLVDQVREEQAERAGNERCMIGVHCHYGFNRTGYFVVCYLVERCGYGVQEAIDEFSAKRPNGIRHSHFLDRLFVRYAPATRK
ncbi:alpha/beta-hydrolase [Daldinia caldariorum]|uniref:alpha/beta-hydrolase n=1 Tax=Daldinia caldariorum TaxID=326644 RepID=UPI00200804B0|nr:alpha/beta-hydrolase [Daldinia caldariorum]KAI1463305.1 alpha/beta-hydrolase [Daldinia caldariorum]